PSMAPPTLLSPAELSYLHASLSLHPPVRPDGRGARQFRPLVAETEILPNANGSARVCFSDGAEAIVGVKAEVEKERSRAVGAIREGLIDAAMGDEDDEANDAAEGQGRGRGKSSWVEIAVDVPGYRDDDALPVFLSQMLGEALVASGRLRDRLWINSRFHWKLYIDILLLSPPLSYPLPLLSLTMHLALLSARLPRLISEGDEDPLFDDDWEASTYLYPFRKDSKDRIDKPPITLLVVTVGDNILFDPSKEELAAAEGVLAVSAGEVASASNEPGEDESNSRPLQLLAVRTVDPPSRLTQLGVPNSLNSATGGAAPVSSVEFLAAREGMEAEGVWTPPRGGIKRATMGKIVKAVIEKGGVGEEVMAALEGFTGV
ncbi:hypothetical protein NA57DRAFT_46143, partial [Rhizodiscina lignyota]